MEKKTKQLCPQWAPGKEDIICSCLVFHPDGAIPYAQLLKDIEVCSNKYAGYYCAHVNNEPTIWKTGLREGNDI